MKVAQKQADNASNRPTAEATQSSRQSQSAQVVDNSKEAIAQRAFIAGIDDSPRMTAQRRQIESYLGSGQPQTTESIHPASSINQLHPIQHLKKPDDEEKEPLQRKFATEFTAQPEQQPAAKPNNTGLPDNLKSGIESLSGLSMDNVKVHYNSSQPAQLNALAYAQGTDIHVAPGQEQHLPHEAWHVVQQVQERVKPTMQVREIAINDNLGLETEANVMGEKAMQMKEKLHGAGLGPVTTTPLQMKRSSESPVQRVVLSRAHASKEKGKSIIEYYSSHEPATGFGTYEEAYDHDIALQAQQDEFDRNRRYPTNFSYHQEKSHNAIPNTKQGPHSLSHSSLSYRLGIRFDTKGFNLRQLRDEQILTKEEFQRLFEIEAPSKINPLQTLRAINDYGLLYDQLETLLTQKNYNIDLAYELVMRLMQMNPYSAYGKGKQGKKRMNNKNERKEDAFSEAFDKNANFNDKAEYVKFQEMRSKLYPLAPENKEEVKGQEPEEYEKPHKKLKHEEQPSPQPGTGYLPTALQNTALGLRNLRLNWIEPDGFCIFASVGVARNKTGLEIQEQVLAAIDNNTNNIRNWITNYGGGLHTYQQVREATANIRNYWNNPIADIMLPLIAQVLNVGFTVINPDATNTIIGNGVHILLRVTNPVAHYHATQI